MVPTLRLHTQARALSPARQEKLGSSWVLGNLVLHGVHRLEEPELPGWFSLFAPAGLHLPECSALFELSAVAPAPNDGLFT